MLVALAGCASIEDPEEPLLVEALGRRGVRAVGRPWDSATDWSAYDLVVVRSTWDYVGRHEEFLAWADSVPRLANPAAVLRDNTDKHYLGRLAAAGLPVVPTTYPDAEWTPPDGEYVVKPTVSAASADTARYRPGQEVQAVAHVRRLLSTGRAAMVQPYLVGVESAHESSLLYLGGEFSHGAYKTAALAGERALHPLELEHGPRAPSPEERLVADAVLDAIDAPLLYARVDLLPGIGGPVLLELELTEPYLFLGTDAAAPDRFAAAIVAACPS